MREILLTFDTEDFVSDNSVPILQWILERLKKYELKGLFFITGHMAEKLEEYPNVVDLLSTHQIGYHSSSHSVHPTIFEFTDIEDYQKAYEISLIRETSHINPITGGIEGKGGILALQDLFPKNHIASFRAPGHCWSPPHLEALRALGIRYDFSARLSLTPVHFKGFTFYPYPIIGYWNGTLSEYNILLNSILRNKVVVITIHPSLIVNPREWDIQFIKSNPQKITQQRPRNPKESSLLMNRFDLLLKRIKAFQKSSLVEVTPDLKMSHEKLNIVADDVMKWYQTSVRWTIGYKYTPKFLYYHFVKFFG